LKTGGRGPKKRVPVRRRRKGSGTVTSAKHLVMFQEEGGRKCEKSNATGKSVQEGGGENSLDLLSRKTINWLGKLDKARGKRCKSIVHQGEERAEPRQGAWVHTTATTALGKGEVQALSGTTKSISLERSDFKKRSPKIKKERWSPLHAAP